MLLQISHVLQMQLCLALKCLEGHHLTSILLCCWFLSLVLVFICGICLFVVVIFFFISFILVDFKSYIMSLHITPTPSSPFPSPLPPPILCFSSLLILQKIQFLYFWKSYIFLIQVISFVIWYQTRIHLIPDQILVTSPTSSFQFNWNTSISLYMQPTYPTLTL